MAKRRRRRKKPNLPKNVLERARQQAGVEEEPADTPDDSSTEEEAGEAPTAERTSRRRKLNPVQLERSRQRGELTHEMIQDVLAHPTKFVTAEELQQEYQHVLYDLRNMGLLAAVLIAIIVGLTFVL